jgi:hypothetical protein
MQAGVHPAFRCPVSHAKPHSPREVDSVLRAKPGAERFCAETRGCVMCDGAEGDGGDTPPLLSAHDLQGFASQDGFFQATSRLRTAYASGTNKLQQDARTDRSAQAAWFEQAADVLGLRSSPNSNSPEHA